MAQMAKLIRLAKSIDTPYRADPDFGTPELVRHRTTQGAFIEETVHLLRPGEEVEVADDRAEYLRQVWGWRLVIRDKP